MTLTEINNALGQDWFKGGDGITAIMYADESDVVEIVVPNVFKAEEVGDYRNLWEYTGEGDIPKELTEAMINGEDEDVICHSIDKWQARGCATV